MKYLLYYIDITTLLTYNQLHTKKKEAIKLHDKFIPWSEFCISSNRGITILTNHVETNRHYHDFHEIIFINTGAMKVTIGEKTISVPQDTLCLIPCAAIHSEFPNSNCSHFNFLITKHTFQSLLIYLNNPQIKLLEMQDQNAFIQTISILETNLIKTRIEEILELQHNYHADFADLKACELLLTMVLHFCSHPSFKGKGLMPEWFQFALDYIQKYPNYIEGLPALLRITKRSHAYLCRNFRTHLHTTPTNYINSLRLNYAGNLLVNSNLEIITIAIESGFDNLSHFYHVFSTYFHTSPLQYRNKARNF